MIARPDVARISWPALLGYDVFISYRRSEAAGYAEQLCCDLQDRGLTVFLDRDETPGGAQLAPALGRALRRSRMLVLLLTPDVLQSQWIKEEVSIFLDLRGRAVLPVNIDGYIQKTDLQETFLAPIPQYSWTDDSAQNLRVGTPSKSVVDEIVRGYSNVRVRILSRAIVATVLFVLALISTVAFVQKQKAKTQADVAFAGQLAARAERIYDESPDQLSLAATLAAESFVRAPSLQAERTIRTALESLPILVHSFPVDSAGEIALSSDGQSVLSKTDSRPFIIKRYDLRGKSLGVAFDCATWAVCDPELDSQWVAVAEKGAARGAVIHVIDTSSAKKVASVNWDRSPIRLLVDAGGQALVAIDDAGVACVWGLASNRRSGCVTGDTEDWWYLSANGRLLASEHDVEEAPNLWKVWKTEDLSEVDLDSDSAETQIAAMTLRMGPTGRYVMAAVNEAHVLGIDAEFALTLPHGVFVRDALFDPAENFLVTNTANSVLSVWVPEADYPRAPILTMQVDGGLELDRITNDGLGIVTRNNVAGSGTTVSVWRFLRRDETLSLVERMRIDHAHDVFSIGTDDKAETIVTLDVNGIVRIWDCRDGNLVEVVRSEEPVEWKETSVATSSDTTARSNAQASGDLVVTSVDFDHLQSDLHPAIGKLPKLGPGGHGATSVDYRFLATYNSDYVVRIWDVQEGRQVSQISTETTILRLQFTEDGRYVRALGDMDVSGKTPIFLYRWRPKDLLQAVSARQIRRLGPQERFDYLGSRQPRF